MKQVEMRDIAQQAAEYAIAKFPGVPVENFVQGALWSAHEFVADLQSRLRELDDENAELKATQGVPADNPTLIGGKSARISDSSNVEHTEYAVVHDNSTNRNYTISCGLYKISKHGGVQYTELNREEIDKLAKSMSTSSTKLVPISRSSTEAILMLAMYLKDTYTDLLLAKKKILSLQHQISELKATQSAPLEDFVWQAKKPGNEHWDSCSKDVHDAIMEGSIAWLGYSARALVVQRERRGPPSMEVTAATEATESNPWYPDDSGLWVEYQGQGIPVSSGIKVQILVRDDRVRREHVGTWSRPASHVNWSWFSCPHGRQVVAYKVISE